MAAYNRSLQVLAFTVQVLELLYHCTDSRDCTNRIGSSHDTGCKVALGGEKYLLRPSMPSYLLRNALQGSLSQRPLSSLFTTPTLFKARPTDTQKPLRSSLAYGWNLRLLLPTPNDTCPPPVTYDQEPSAPAHPPREQE